jgi:uncharacterized protein
MAANSPSVFGGDRAQDEADAGRGQPSARSAWRRHREEGTMWPISPREDAMPYAIKTTDRPGHAELRAKLREQHLAYLDSQMSILLAAGALLSDDGKSASGGLLVVDTDDRAAAQRFIDNDPFTKNGLFSQVTIERWRKAYFDKKRFI